MRWQLALPSVPRMNQTSAALLVAGVLAGFLPHRLLAQETARGADPPLETRIWLDRGVDPVFEQGDRARVYYRSSLDSYLLVFHIDTDGVLQLLFSGADDGTPRARGGRDYQLLFPDSDQWQVEDPPGVGYFFVLAATQPFAFERLSDVPVAGGWNSTPGENRIRSDPYVTVEELRRVLLPGVDDEYAIDFTPYHVGQSYSYPRFLCFQCHAAQPFEEWNPYHQTCLDVRVVIFNDPYYYPATRYRSDAVIYARPPDPGLPQYAFTRRIPGEAGTPIVRSRTVASGAIRTNAPFAPSGSGGQALERVLMRRVEGAGSAGRGVPRSPVVSTSSPDGTRPAPEPAGRADPGVLPVVPRTRANSDRPTLRRRD